MPRAAGFGEDPVHDNPTDWVGKHIRNFVESDGEKGNTFHGHDALLPHDSAAGARASGAGPRSGTTRTATACCLSARTEGLPAIRRGT